MPRILKLKMRHINAIGEILPKYRVMIGEIIRWISPGKRLRTCNSVTCETDVTDSSELTNSSSGKIENSR